MKLFGQPLGKLCSPKAMKQLNDAIQEASQLSTSGHFISNKHKRFSSSATATAIRKLASLDVNDNHPGNTKLQREHRRRLMLAVLPEPVKRLLVEIYLKGPQTVGIFRKSPSAKQCKELRQKLEADSHASMDEFQVNVIASVFKEWLRSLPDSLLMSRLYPQWIDAAKLIEPLHQHNQLRHRHYIEQHLLLMSTLQCRSQSALNQRQTYAPDDGTLNGNRTTQIETNTPSASRSSDSNSDNSIEESPSVRLPASPLTDNSGLAADEIDPDNLSARRRGHQQQQNNNRHQLPEMARRAISCSTISQARSTINLSAGHSDNSRQSSIINDHHDNKWSEFALQERHSECLRIVRQLLDALNVSNLILLRALLSVLWHIHENREENKMSANNLGICVGQSLLNDDNQPTSPFSFDSSIISTSSSSTSASSSSSGLHKRHRRTRSQCLLSSTLWLAMSPTATATNNHHHSNENGSPSTGSMAALHQPSGYLSSNGAQETAKYVPILLAFMIENAPALFGDDIVSMFDDAEILERRAKILAELGSEREQQQQQQNHHDQADESMNTLQSSQQVVEESTTGSITDNSIIVTREDKNNNTNNNSNSDRETFATSTATRKLSRESSGVCVGQDQADASILSPSFGLKSRAELDNEQPKSLATRHKIEVRVGSHELNNGQGNQLDQGEHEHDATTTSILIVNSSAPKAKQQQQQQQQQQQHLTRQQAIASSPSSGVSTNLSSSSCVSTNSSPSPPLASSMHDRGAGYDMRRYSQYDQPNSYQRPSLKPERSHVMLLRDYYLSLQHEQMLQQQRLYAYRSQHNTNQNHNQSHNQQQLRQQPPVMTSYTLARQPAQYQQSHYGSLAVQPTQQQHQQQQQQQQVLASAAIHQLASHQLVQRPTPRLAKIRQNQFNTIAYANLPNGAPLAQPIQQLRPTNAAIVVNPLSANSILISHHQLNRVAAAAAAAKQQQQQQHQSTLTVKSKSASSDDNQYSSDDSDDSSSEWMESTMV